MHAIVVGNGGFGTALAIVLAEARHEVTVWGHDPEYTAEIDRTRRNRKFLPEAAIPASIRFVSETSALPAAPAAVVWAVPTRFLGDVAEELRGSFPDGALFISCAKGFDPSTSARPSEVLASRVPTARVAILSGPSHAEEIGRRLATTVVIAASDADTAREARELFSTPVFRAYSSSDPVGVELAGAAKNVIALAAGISDGLGLGDNARAGLVCRGAHEITRLGEAFGASPRTFAGLSGIGDLIATCTSSHSRNRSVGLRLARGESLDDILRSTEQVAEGVSTTRTLHALAAARGVDLPITAAVHGVLFDDKSPHRAVEELMTRELKDE